MKREYDKGGQTISDYLRSKGYQTCEYLYSNGDQYINTGLFPDGDTVYECKFKVPSYPTPHRGIMGVDVMISWVTSFVSGFEIWEYYGSILELICYNGTHGNRAILDEICTIKLDANIGYYSDGTVSTFTKNHDSSVYPIYIFTVNQPKQKRVEGNTPLYIYYCSINEHKFYPVYNTSTGEGAMWDAVEDKFYFNQGTGLFTHGADVEINDKY